MTTPKREYAPGRITRAEFARRMDLTKGAVTRAVQSGRLTLGPDKRLPWPECVEEYERKTRSDSRHHGEEKTAHLNEVRARKVDAETELKLLTLRERRGELVPLDEVRGKVAAAFGALRDRLLAVPARISRDVAHETDTSQCRIIMDREIRAALEGFTSEYHGD